MRASGGCHGGTPASLTAPDAEVRQDRRACTPVGRGLHGAKSVTERRAARRREPRGIPESFELVLDATGEQHPCRVIWRGEDRLGVEFG